MSEFEDRLNGILNNPQEMEKIMAMARNLMGGGGSADQPQAGAAPPPVPPSPAPGATGSGGPDLAGLLGGIDPGAVQKLMKGFSGGGGTAALLTSITPHLKDTRQGQLKRAIMIAQMVRVARGYFSE
ncbi:MAG: hypothetical protein FWD84_02730 [Oscillospiraceae bacterium]|nr:hypothetical protein [Oscillospiraceae bacterium]